MRLEHVLVELVFFLLGFFKLGTSDFIESLVDLLSQVKAIDANFGIGEVGSNDGNEGLVHVDGEVFDCQFLPIGENTCCRP